MSAGTCRRCSPGAWPVASTRGRGKAPLTVSLGHLERGLHVRPFVLGTFLVNLSLGHQLLVASDRPFMLLSTLSWGLSSGPSGTRLWASWTPSWSPAPYQAQRC